MLKWIIKEYINVQVHGLSYLAISACSVMSECSEYFNKTLSSMTGGKFLKRLKSSDSENSCFFPSLVVSYLNTLLRRNTCIQIHQIDYTGAVHKLFIHVKKYYD
jgi:hypothetical protein